MEQGILCSIIFKKGIVMKFNYYEFGINIYEGLFLKNKGEKQIFVFHSETEKSRAKFYYSDFFKFENNILLTMQELKDMIFNSKYPILREEKRILIFYKILTKEEREFFGIRTYFDSIDIANNFFILMSELCEADIEDVRNIIELNEKQLKIYEKFQNIKKRYELKLKELLFEDYIFINKKSNLDISYLSDYEKAIFVNIPYFTNLEKQFINILKKSMQCELYIYGSESYCEETMKIKNIVFDKKLIKNSLNIKVFEDKFIQTVNIANSILKDKKTGVIECDSEGSYKKFISKNLLPYDDNIEFTESLIFKFTACLYNLYNSMEVINGNRVLNGEILLETLLFKEFADYFNIKDKKEIISIINNGNKYIDSSVKSIAMITAEIEKIDKIKNIGDCLNYLLSIDLSKLRENSYKNAEETFHSAIFEMSSMESMKIIEQNEYEYFFGNRVAENIFRLVLKFLRFKKIKPAHLTLKSENKMFDFKNCTPVLTEYDKLIFLNVYEGVLPAKKRNNFLFTEQQRKELGILGFEDRRNYEKFKFTSLLSSAENVEIYTIYNENKNISVSSFIEELILNCNIKAEKPEIESADYSKIMESIYGEGKEYSFEIEEIIKRDVEIENMRIGYYDFSNLKKCGYKFYLKKIAKLEREYPKISYAPEMAVIGIIVHDIFRVIFEEIKKSGINSFNKENTVKIIKSRINENREKFPIPYIPYYTKIIAEHIVLSIEYFIEKNRIFLEAADIFPEKSIEKPIEESTLKLTGRIDLMSVKNGKSAIFDYKTGSGNQEQLDFYQSIIEKDEEEEIDKIIYSVFKMENDISKKRKLSFEEIEKTVIEFIKSEFYKKSEKESDCIMCEYFELCRPY